MKPCSVLAGTVALLLGLFATVSLAQVSEIAVELNKLEQRDAACRAYLVTQNLSDTDFESLQLDIVMFDDEGIVAKRLAVEVGPMPAGKTTLKAFDIQDLSCENIGQLLLNDVLQCRDENGERDDCMALIEVSSRSDVSFIN